MEITRSELTAALRTVGLVGTVESGMFDNVLTPGGSTTENIEYWYEMY